MDTENLFFQITGERIQEDAGTDTRQGPCSVVNDKEVISESFKSM